MPFLRNAWYAAGWKHEIDDKPLSRTILDEPVVIFKGVDGEPVALIDRCSHRFAPLSLGKVDGDTIQCPYHGLTFGRDGSCVRNPHGKGAIVSSMHVKSFPALVQNGMIWIWAGDKEKVTGRPPSYDFLEQEGWSVMHGYLHVSANYELVTDNLLDLSHAEYLHPFIAPPGTAAAIRYKAVEKDGAVTAFHSMPDQPNTPLFKLLLDDAVERVDGRAHMHWQAPANMMLDTGATPVGESVEEGASIPQAHLLTPETENTTHYFWGLARNRLIDDAAITDMLFAGINNAFQFEDEPMIRAVHERMRGRALFDLSPALLPMDEAAVRARRILARRIAEERQVSA